MLWYAASKLLATALPPFMRDPGRGGKALLLAVQAVTYACNSWEHAGKSEEAQRRRQAAVEAATSALHVMHAGRDTWRGMLAAGGEAAGLDRRQRDACIAWLEAAGQRVDWQDLRKPTSNMACIISQHLHISLLSCRAIHGAFCTEPATHPIWPRALAALAGALHRLADAAPPGAADGALDVAYVVAACYLHLQTPFVEAYVQTVPEQADSQHDRLLARLAAREAGRRG